MNHAQLTVATNRDEKFLSAIGCGVRDRASTDSNYPGGRSPPGDRTPQFGELPIAHDLSRRIELRRVALSAVRSN